MQFKPSFFWRRVAQPAWPRNLAVAVSLASVLWACGGGVGSGGTGGFASGPITGFGSVIVNDVRFDDSSPTIDISDADGVRRSRDDLRLGMTVEVESGAITTDANGVATAQASRIRVESELRGPVLAVDAGTGSFTVLGQKVVVTAATVFAESINGGLSGLTGAGAPAAVEVYATFDAATNSYRALRVDPAAADAALRLRGPVQQIDNAAQTVRIGNANYSIGALTQPPSGLAAGQIVRLQLQPASGAGNLAVKSWGSTVQPVADTDAVKLRGVVSAFTSLSNFSVDGRRVDGSAASVNSSGGAVALGARVDVEGPVVGGVLRATKVTVGSDEDDRSRGFEISGAISAVAATGTAGQPSFVLRGQTITTARADLRYDNGSAAFIKEKANVEVKGVLSADRRTVEATRIRFY